MRTLSILTLLIGALLTSCSQPPQATPSPSPRPALPGALTRYPGPTPSVTPSLTPADTPTPLPTVTPTPRTHTIRLGDDLFGISLFYDITLQDLLAANPTVQPNLLRVGDSLIIPAAQYTPTIDPKNPPLPTPVGLSLDQPACFPVNPGGIWCFGLARNDQSYAVESISAVFRLYNRASGEILAKTAYPPLNRLAAGEILPLAVYFPAPAAQNFSASIELLTALPLPPDDQRYISLEISHPVTTYSDDRFSAEVSGSLALAAGQPSAAMVTLAAAALDDTGRVVGLRRWEYNQPLESGESLPFQVKVYSSGAPIAQVLLFSEGLP
ncbi:MAG: LysM domain-containing protein [Chloroflexota bacterium]|jgi:LysM repeat protein